MASTMKRIVRSPVAWILAAQTAASLATGIMLTIELQRRRLSPGSGSPASASPLSAWLSSMGYRATPAGLLWEMLGPLVLVGVASFVVGLVFGRWGLPGHRQARAVVLAPLLAAGYFCVGTFLYLLSVSSSAGSALRQTTQFLLVDASGIVLMAVYVALSLTVVTIGSAAAMAIAHWMRARGKWETIGYDHERRWPHVMARRPLLFGPLMLLVHMALMQVVLSVSGESGFMTEAFARFRWAAWALAFGIPLAATLILARLRRTDGLGLRRLHWLAAIFVAQLFLHYCFLSVRDDLASRGSDVVLERLATALAEGRYWLGFVTDFGGWLAAPAVWLAMALAPQGSAEKTVPDTR